MPRTTKTITISLPPKLYEEVEEIATRFNKTKSELFRDMLRVYEEYLEEREWRKIRNRGADSAVRHLLENESDIEKIIHEVRGKANQR
ncbi:MAG: ribbon-helix-helix protein, CopG family [Actinobacteria bacterium]|nr:ribbon-helix-helix protein, CopG family [Actinomycetota bacterium]